MTKKRKKELNRIRSFIRKAEKRGYEFDASFKEQLKNKTTRALQFITVRKLYENAKFKSDAEGMVSGLRGRQIERELAAKKSVETRRINKLKKKYNQEEYIPSAFDLVYQNVVDIIDSFPSSEGAIYLKNLLESEIKSYGLHMVIRGMDAAPEDLIKQAQEIVYYEQNSLKLHDALRSFSDAIRGGIVLSKEESKQMNEILEVMGESY